MITATEARQMAREIKSEEYNSKMAKIEEEIKLAIFTGECKVSVDSLTDLQMLELTHLGYSLNQCYNGGFEIMW